jgi:hypothetical protein
MALGIRASFDGGSLRPGGRHGVPCWSSGEGTQDLAFLTTDFTDFTDFFIRENFPGQTSRNAGRIEFGVDYLSRLTTWRALNGCTSSHRVVLRNPTPKNLCNLCNLWLKSFMPPRQRALLGDLKRRHSLSDRRLVLRGPSIRGTRGGMRERDFHLRLCSLECIALG